MSGKLKITGTEEGKVRAGIERPTGFCGGFCFGFYCDSELYNLKGGGTVEGVLRGRLT